ncbi:ABC transporter substrate-binding protein [Deinococcus irradiatisoli]|uniref:ABC transporter substrate-binding protein n=1 Tax=Deinococcus irradiatisoli TaxID=2202254 RepID=A0A2Z3JBR3_9DEIO|nr:ABC transporter substrate-binding protein [Deinococcus irradiatisoli]AWN22587.1 ABC transporter substrate-binding protein [Deinococcus irradiatisoli]
MTHRTPTILAVLILPMLSLASAQGSTVRIGFFPNLTHAPALVAIEKGYYAAQMKGVKIETKDFVSGTTLSEAFAAGAIDIGLIGPGPAINAAVKGMPVQIIAGASEAGALLVARKGSGITSYKDLAGKKVAVPSLGNTQDISLRAILADAGLKAQTDGGNVTIVPLAPADVAAAFVSKQVDAALVPEPWAALLEGQGNKAVGDEKTVWRNGNYPSALVIVSTKFAQANPEIVKGFLRAHLQAIRFINKSPAAAQTAVSSALFKLTNQKVDARVLQLALKRTRFTANVDIEALKAYSQLNLAAGYSRKAPDFDALVDLTMLNALNASQGQLQATPRTALGLK